MRDATKWKSCIALATLAVCGLLAAGNATAVQQSDVRSAVQTARGVLERVIPEHAEYFILESIPQENGQDVFEIEGRGKRVVLRGSNGVAICSALNVYLKYFCHADFSWSGSQLDLPDPLPTVPEKIRRTSPHKYRYFFNYCCFGYSLAWWDWEQWERMIDWMAMNGINMPLAVTGQEAVWQAVLRDFGLNESDIQSFLAGPPYLPFGWMGCLDGWGGPLGQDWIDRHADLQKRILARERALGMTPVLQGFTGHIPPAIRGISPDTELHEIDWVEWKTSFIDPLDPLFKEFGKAFVEKQIELFGTDHLYAADTFIEMSPPSNEPEFLRTMGKTLSDTLTVADPKAVWIMQGWVFLNNAKFWQPPQAKAFLSGVPDDRMMLIDLFCDVAPVWKVTEAFHGKPWIWCILQNFGNTVQLSGPLPRINKELHAARADPERGNLTGIGMIQEGLGYNPIVFDFMTEMTWRDDPVDLDQWVRTYAHRRYGERLPEAERAWKVLQDTVYSGTTGNPSVIRKRPALNVTGSLGDLRLAEAWKHLLDCAARLDGVDTYRFDLVNVTRQALTNLSGSFSAEIISAYHEEDRDGLAAASSAYGDLVNDLDAILATREEFLLGKWLEDAKRWGTGEKERQTYEWNARNVITLWGDRESRLHDYARKEWSGVMKGFYLPRWELFVQHLDRSLREETPFDPKTFDREVKILEEEWTRRTDSYPAVPKGDSVALVQKLFAKYYPVYEQVLEPHLAVGKPATASDTHLEFSPARAVDGNAQNLDSSWQSASHPQWLQIDLEKPARIDRIRLFPFWDNTRYYRYTIEVSHDGNEWKEVVDMRTNIQPATAIGRLHRFAPVETRFVRVNMLSNSANPGVHIVEVQIHEAK